MTASPGPNRHVDSLRAKLIPVYVVVILALVTPTTLLEWVQVGCTLFFTWLTEQCYKRAHRADVEAQRDAQYDAAWGDVEERARAALTRKEAVVGDDDAVSSRSR